MKHYILLTFLSSTLVSIPFILLAWGAVLFTWHRQHKTTRWLWLIALAGLIAALVNIFRNTLSLEPFLNGFQFEGHNINLVPFNGIFKMINDLLSTDPSNYSIINFFGNIGFFIPIGFFPVFLSKKLASAWKIVLFGALVSLFIEVFQLFIPTRGSDIDDIILNTLGTAVGFLLYRVVARLFPKFIRHFH